MRRRTLEKRAVPTNVQAALAEVKAGLVGLYGDRLRGVYLYGSYARGDYRADSDIDVLVVLAGPVLIGDEIRRSSGVVAEVSLRHDLVILVFPISEDTKQTAATSFLSVIGREAVRL